jgi:hypothetical protein
MRYTPSLRVLQWLAPSFGARRVTSKIRVASSGLSAVATCSKFRPYSPARRCSVNRLLQFATRRAPTLHPTFHPRRAARSAARRASSALIRPAIGESHQFQKLRIRQLDPGAHRCVYSLQPVVPVSWCTGVFSTRQL